MDEKYYLKEIKKGNQEALNAFIEELYPPVYRYVYCKVSGKEYAKDITQEVFLRFIRQLPNYQHNGKLLAYLYTIAMNCCHSYYQQNKRHSYMEWNDDYMDDKSDLNETILDQIVFEQLMVFLQKLPEKDQDVIIFHYLKQMTFKEIAQLLEENENSIKTRHYRALVKIKKLWKEGDI